MRIIGNNPAADNAEITAVASGTLPSGKTVVVNADGTVSVVASSGGSPAFGTATVFEAASSPNIGTGFDSNSNRIVISYADAGNSNYGTAVVGQVSGTSITFGTPVVFESAGTESTSVVFDSNLNKIVIGYVDTGNVSSGTAIVGTINSSNNSITFGSATVFLQGYADRITGVFDSNSNKVVFSYRVTYETGYSSVGTVSGTGISFGSAVGFNTGGGNIGSTFSVSSVFDSSNNKVVIAYRGPGNDGTAIVGTVSGTSISFGTYVAYTGNVANYNEIVFDSNSNKVAIFYQDAGNSGYGTGVVGTVSGTGISFGTPVVLVSSSSTRFAPVFDTTVNKTMVFYQNDGNADKGYYVFGTISGTAISFTSPVLFNDAATSHQSSTFDSNSNTIVVAYRNGGNSLYGTALAYQASPANLTAENFIGFSGGVVNVESGTQAIGSEVVFESADTRMEGGQSAVFDNNLNKVVFVYWDVGNSSYGTAVVGTVSGTSISFGTPVVFESATTEYVSATFDSTNNKVVVVYSDRGNSDYGTAIVGTVSGTSISFGSPVVFESADAEFTVATFDSNLSKVVVAYHDNGNSSYGTAVVGTVSGTGISFGTPVVFEAADTRDISATFDSTSNKVIIAYKDVGNSNHGTAIVGTVSGTNISFGSAAVYEAAEASFNSVEFDPVNNKVVVVYQDSGNSSYGTAVVGTVSGTSISFGTAVVFSASSTQYPVAVFDNNAGKTIITYEDAGDSSKGKYSVGTISGTSITFDTAVLYSDGVGFLSTTYDSNSNKVVNGFRDSSNGYGTAVVIQPAFTNITRAEVASGSNAVIDIGSAISTNQSGLTAGQQYFVQADGTLGLTAGSPSVIAGTAVSATDIIVKG